jgi:hypothetical protein
MLIGHIDAREIHLLPRLSLRRLGGRSAVLNFLNQLQSDPAAVRAMTGFLEERDVDRGSSAGGPGSVSDRLADLIASGEALVGATEPQLLWRHAVSSRDRSSALAFLRRLRTSAGAMWNLRQFVWKSTGSTDLSRIDDDQILEQVATLVSSGEAVIGFRMLLRGGGGGAEEAPARPQPAPAAAPPSPRAEREREADPPTFVPHHDAAMQAQALIAAAQNGVPFCEECARAARRS